MYLKAIVCSVHRNRRVGSLLMERLVTSAREPKARAVVCETQAENYPAICFYTKHGFLMDGIDVSFYHNDDLEKQNIALFLKKHLPS